MATNFNASMVPSKTITPHPQAIGLANAIDDLHQMESYFTSDQFHLLNIRYTLLPPAQIEATVDFKYGKIYRSKLKDIQQCLLVML